MQLRTMDLIPDDIKLERNVAVGISPGRTSKSVKCRTSRSQFEEIPFHRDEDMGITYRPSDHVYLDNSRTDQPYFICAIEGLKLTKRSNVLAIVRWIYRPSEVPDSVYQLLVQDRHTEDTGNNLVLTDPLIQSREVFISDVSDTYPISTLRGKCRVVEYQDLASVRDFKPLPDTFFSVLRYNPDTKRLANTQGEIRVGPSHQVVLPAYRPDVPPDQMPERESNWEDLVWRPSMIIDNDLLIYLHAVRSMAAFVGMCDGGSTEDGCIAASMDETTSNALDTLHKNDYDTGMSLQALVKTINPKSIEKRWSEEDAKKFVKGLRMYGKNFFKIQSELLLNKDTCQLVEYYYFWKKTPSALTSRPHRRHRRTTNLRKQTRTPQLSSGEYLDLSSASELSDNDSDDSDSRELSGYSCRHCYTTKSKDWHHGGRENVLLCTECRHFYKKYGEDRPLDKAHDHLSHDHLSHDHLSHDLPPFLFKPVRDDDSDKLSKDTRGSPGLNSDASSPKSPSADSLSSSCSGRDYRDSHSKREDRHVDSSDPEDSKPLKRRKEEWCDSASECFTDSSSGCNDDIRQVTERNQDELTSATSSSAPSPTDDSDHKPLPTPPYCNEDIKPTLNADTTVVTSDTTVTDTCSGSTVASIGAMQERVTVTPVTVTPVADVCIKTEVKMEPVDYDWPTTDAVVSSDLLTFRGGDTTDADNVCGTSQRPAVIQRPARDESLPLQGPPPPPLKPSSPRMSSLPFVCWNSPATSQRSSPVTLQRASLVCSRRASPAALGARASPGLTHRGSPDLVMHRPSPVPMIRGSPPLMHRGSPVSQRRGSPLAIHHGYPRMAPHLIGQSSRTGFAPFQGSRTVYQQHQLSGVTYPSDAEAQRPLEVPSQGIQGPSQGPHGISPGLHGPSYGLQGPSQGPPPLVSTAMTQPHQLLDVHCKQEPPETPPPLVPGSPHMSPHMRQGSPHMRQGSPHIRQGSPHMRQGSPHMRQGSPHMRQGSPHMRHGSPHTRTETPPVVTPMRPHSPTRSRSRSPVRDVGSPVRDAGSPVRDAGSPGSDTATAPRSPSPPARLVNEECYRSKSAIFIKHWSRGWNSCSRCDFEFKPLSTPRTPSSQHPDPHRSKPTATQLKSTVTIKMERKEELKEEESHAKKRYTPPENRSADAQITSNFMSTQQIPAYAAGAERHTPRGAYMGPDPTPALRQLSEYARPHALGVQQDPQLAYSLGQMGQVVDPYYAMASMYPPGSRERLEIELERDKRERDARERDMRERELREMELREKMKQELEMKPPGLERFAGSLPEWVELQRRYSMMLPPGGQPPGSMAMHGAPHIPGVYPPASLANDLLQRERERLERLDPVMAERLSAEWLQSEQRMAMAADPMVRLQMAGLHQSAAVAAAAAAAHTHTHAHAHTHLHLHQPDPALGVPLGLGPQTPAAAEAAARGLPGPYPLPHGHPLMMAAREQELLYRDLLSRPPYSTDPILAHQLMVQAAAQQETLQRQVAIERDRLCLPPWNGQ